MLPKVTIGRVVQQRGQLRPIQVLLHRAVIRCLFLRELLIWYPIMPMAEQILRDHRQNGMGRTLNCIPQFLHVRITNSGDGRHLQTGL